MRYFMIDRITDLRIGESASAIKNVTLAEDVLHDHFPDYPVLPGTFLIEAMAQLGGFLLEISLNKPELIRRAILMQVEQAKFYRPAEPGDQLVLNAEITQQMDDAAKINANVNLGTDKVALAKLTFVMKELDSENIHRQRRYLYRLWTKHLNPKPLIL